MSLETTTTWIYDSPVSAMIRDVTWIIPTIQSIHLCAIAVLIGSALISEMRLAGLIATDESAGAVVRRYVPWMGAALIVLLFSGGVMVVGEPERVIANQTFWIKMGLVLFAFVLTLFFRRPFLDPQFRAEHARWARLVKPMAFVLLLVWIAVIFCGRWIAYV